MAAGRGSPNPMPAGLSALLKPDSTPSGMSSGNMQQVMSRAKSLSDRQLADVLEGKSLVVPQYVAMTEAMGRRSLRTAMEGQQAMAQAKQPSVKDKLLMGDQPQMLQGMPQGMPQQPMMAAEGGLASLPAPNMDTVDMADGGIIAFNGEKNEQLVPATDLTEEEKKQLAENPYMQRVQAIGGLGGQLKDALTDPRNYNPIDLYQRIIGQPFSRFANQSPREQRVAFDKASEARKGERGTFTNAPADVARDTKAVTEARQKDVKEIKDAQTNKAMKAAGVTPTDIEQAEIGMAMQQMLNAPGKSDKKESGAPARAAAAGPAVVPGVSQTDSGMGSLKSYMDAIKANQEDYYKKVEGLGAKQREGLAQLKSQGGGEALMNIAQGLLSKAGLAQGISAGLPGVIQTASASRKEQRAVENLANEYDMNLAKSRAADAKGNTEAALRYMGLADEAKYRAGVLANQVEENKLKKEALNKPTGELQVLQALQKPGETLNDTYARIYEARQNPKSTQALREAYLKSPFLQMQFPNIDDYIRTMTPTGAAGTLVSNTGGFNAVYDSNNKLIK
jgi:hypothetical protein